MLPFCDRVVSVPRKDVAPVWTRSFPIANEPTTLGQHLKKKRFLAGIRQSEAALKLGVSKRTLSTWETDRVYPAWTFQSRLITYLGYNPFNDPTLGRPKGNETSCVAILSPDAPVGGGTGAELSAAWPALGLPATLTARRQIRLQKLVAAQPDATLAELGSRLDRPFGTSTVDLWLRRLGLSYKKTLHAAERRVHWHEQLAAEPVARLGLDENLRPRCNTIAG
jgi:DNA-binding XRE family transcriptional regulator